MTRQPLTLQYLAKLTADAAFNAAEHGIKRTHALTSIAQIEGFPSWEALMAQASKDLGMRGEVLRRAIAQEGRPEKPSESRQQRAQRFGNPSSLNPSRTRHSLRKRFKMVLMCLGRN